MELGWSDLDQRAELVAQLNNQGWLRNKELTAPARDGSLIHILASARVIAPGGQRLCRGW